jgi:hypothetical protein
VTLVSIVTPTMVGREDVLLDRCIPSVEAQDWGGEIQHVVVSDRNPGLRWKVPDHVTFVEINESWRDGVRDRSCGAYPWRLGSMLALGEFVGFLGDDDELLPHHVTRHVEALQVADFTVSRVQFVVGGEPRFVVGDDSFAWTHLDSDGVMCRADALQVATWDPYDVADERYANAADYRLVRDWRDRGLVGGFVDDVTAIHHDGWAAK